MKRLLSLISLLTATLAFGDVPSDPVGVFNLPLRGNSDTLVSLPLHRPALVEASIQTLTGNQLELTDTVPSLPVGGAYVLIMSGSLEGAVLPITALSGNTVTVATTAFDLSGLHTESVNGLAAGDVAAVIPYWTLDTAFPAGAGINISASASVRSTEILFFSSTATGTNLSAYCNFFYFVGNMSKPAGWYQVGNTATTHGEQRIDPSTYFIVRHNVATDTALALSGCIQMTGYSVPLALRAPLIDQDNLVSLPIATPVTLGNSSLIQSGAFTPSTSAASRMDELLVFNNATIGQNKSASATYFYFVGNTTKPAGWYQVGNTATTANGTLLKPGEGYIIRKRQASAARTDVWNGLPSYLQ